MFEDVLALVLTPEAVLAFFTAVVSPWVTVQVKKWLGDKGSHLAVAINLAVAVVLFGAIGFFVFGPLAVETWIGYATAAAGLGSVGVALNRKRTDSKK